jgi:hypothetical protein
MSAIGIDPTLIKLFACHCIVYCYDGVKVNYQKFGPALKKIPGLDAKEE